jgi:hypothetical protein
VWRKAQEVGLQGLFAEDEEVRTFIKSLPALAFLPVEEVMRGFEIVEEEVDEMDDRLRARLRALMDYFEDNYIGRRDRRGRRRPPPFPIETWNVHTAVLEKRARTQNRVEGWHRAIQGHFDGSHPSMWRFLLGIQKEEGLQFSEVVRMRAGVEGPRQKKQYAEISARLERLVTSFAGGADIKAFLRGVSYNLSMNA